MAVRECRGGAGRRRTMLPRDAIPALGAERRRRPEPAPALTYNGAPSQGGNAAMTLVLTNADVEALLTPRACIEPLEQAYREFALGEAANRARSHSYFPVESKAHPRFHYRFKSQE